MRAITTHYKGPTDTRGSRIVASYPTGERVTVAYDSALSSRENHEAAATALRAEIFAPGAMPRWVSGELGDGSYAHVYVPEAP